MQQIMNIDYAKCLKIVISKIPLALLIATLGAISCAIVCFYTLEKEDIYSARASVLTRSTNEYGNAAEGVQYAELVKSLTVANRAMRILGERAPSQYEIYDMVSVEFDNSSPYVTSSAVINIHASAKNPADAIAVANAVAQAFVDEVNILIKRDTDISLLDSASVAPRTYNARREMIKYSVIAAAAGLLLVCAIAVIIDILSFRLISVQDGTLFGKLEVIGVIPDNRD